VTHDDLRTRLARADVNTLATFLARLAEEDAALRERIETLALRQAPSDYARSLDRRLRRLRNGRAFISYEESGEFARELEAWLDDVETGLLEADPGTACELVDRFVQSDAQILERADDSNGSIGDAYRRACGLWHRAAAALPADTARVERVHELHAGNDYGTRDAILDEAATSLSELELRRLARIYEDEAEADPDDDDDRALGATTAMGQVACALGDAALYERSVRIRSPEPNALQAEDIAKQYLRFGPAERAIEWLTRPEDRTDRHRRERLDLLAEAYERLGQSDALLDARRRLSERSLSPERFAEYAALLPDDERDAARRAALDRAERSDRAVAAARFLLALGEDERAAALVLHRHDQLGDAFYGDLLELAQHLEKAGRPLPAIACYRTLTDQILEQGRSKAYRHAQRYVDRLAQLDTTVDDHGDLPTHAQYIAGLRQHRGRKYSFWNRIDGANG